MAAIGGGSQGTPSQVTVFTDLEALTTDDAGHAELDNTAPITNKTAQRLACDAVIEPVLRTGGEVVGVGRRSRNISGWLRRLVHQRDGGQCQHPGCRNTRWLQVHHSVAWAQGGPTDLDKPHPLVRLSSPVGPSAGLAHHRATRPTRLPPTQLDAISTSATTSRSESPRTRPIYLGQCAPTSINPSSKSIPITV
jgi:hypothetical protein